MGRGFVRAGDNHQGQLARSTEHAAASRIDREMEAQRRATELEAELANYVAPDLRGRRRKFA